MLSTIIAQAADPISNGAGWVGAGLLGAVLAWLLLVHVPHMVKQMRELIASKDAAMAEVVKQTRELIDAKDEAISDIVKAFKEEAREARLGNRELVNYLCEEWKQDMLAERASCTQNFQAIAKSIELMAQKGRHP